MKKALVLLCMLPTLFSCEKVLFEEDLASEGAVENFEYLWNECNEKYSYFEVKGIDWNVVKSKYAAQVYDGMSDDSLFKVMSSMLRELRDGHVNLASNFNASFFNIYGLGPDNFEWRTVTDHYLPENYYISGPFQHDFIANGEVGYVRFQAFSGQVSNLNLDFVMERYQNTKGLILDLRENGGGQPSDMFQILSRFVTQKTTLYYSRIKDGSGANDFSKTEAATVEPFDGPRYSNKVMVLVDRGTYSAGSFTALSTKALDNVVLVGDTTGGGLGLPNGGQLPNGWTYRFSVSQALTLDLDPSYENGVPPDIVSYFDFTDLTKDEVIERALQELL